MRREQVVSISSCSHSTATCPPKPALIVDAIEASRRRAVPSGGLANLLLPLKRLMPDRFFDRVRRKSLELPKTPAGRQR